MLGIAFYLFLQHSSNHIDRVEFKLRLLSRFNRLLGALNQGVSRHFCNVPKALLQIAKSQRAKKWSLLQVNRTFFDHRSLEHEVGSLEAVVSKLIKNWDSWHTSKL